MPVVTIINRHFFKTVVSARCMSLSWYSNYLQSSSKQTVNRERFCLGRKLPLVTSSTSFQCRFKYDKYSSKKGAEEVDDSTNNKDFLEGVDGNDTKIATVRVTSLRMDLIVKSGLGLARNKIETAFYDSRIRVNGKKVAKKSVSLRVGDEIDVIKGVSPLNNEYLIVSRLEILRATANEEDISVALRRFKSLTIENYSGQNIYKQISSEN